MRRLTSLLGTITGALEGPTQPVLPSARPTSLYEAGRVGAVPAQRPDRRETPPDARVESAQEPTAEERTGRRERPMPARRRPVAQDPEATTLVARRIRATLQDPESLRTAILLREVLDPPVSRRPRKR